MNNVVVPIREERDILIARRSGRDLARDAGFGLADQTRLATAISELVRNVIQYAGEGTCTISREDTEGVDRIRVIVEDSGPGISDLEAALTDGFTSGGGMGAGLPGARRLVEHFDIASRPGQTKITLELVRSGRR